MMAGKRLKALDIMRGITVAGMILVNNPGDWGNVFAPLRHAEWHGLTPTDLVFPFFMFIMGVSTYFSLYKYDFRFSWSSFAKILRRSVLIFLIGLALTWFALFLQGIYGGAGLWNAMFSFDHIRVLGVLPRLAICYGVGALIALVIRPQRLPWIVGAFLVLYAIILFLGNGFEFSEENVIAVVDKAVLGPDHMYHDSVGGLRCAFDPEGLLSTLPSIAHMLIGFICGAMIKGSSDNERRINSLFILGVVLTFSGLLLSYGIPVNKKIWSPTFVLTTCGLASSFLGLLIWIIDIRGYRKWCTFFDVFGVNPLFLYCLATMLAYIFGSVAICGETIHSWIFYHCLQPVCGENYCFASLLYALLFVMLNWCVGLPLYRRKIFIKI